MACIYRFQGKDYTKEEFEILIKDKFKKSSGNQFLDLLAKDNNWVTFFTKAIIQDSAKKGYEKVLFPGGDTANRVEGQTILEEYIKQREELIQNAYHDLYLIEKVTPEFLKELKYQYEQAENQFKLNPDNEYNANNAAYTEIEFNNAKEEFKHRDSIITNVQNRINRFEKELEDAKSGKNKFQTINSFYETTIQNILKKQDYNPVEIKDEYDNKWFEIKLEDKYKKATALTRSNKVVLNVEGKPSLEIEDKNRCN